jgi:hypothetical protein
MGHQRSLSTGPLRCAFCRESRSGAHTLTAQPNRRMSPFVLSDFSLAHFLRIDKVRCSCALHGRPTLHCSAGRVEGEAPVVSSSIYLHKLHNTCRCGCSCSVQPTAATTVSVRISDSSRSNSIRLLHLMRKLTVQPRGMLRTTHI